MWFPLTHKSVPLFLHLSSHSSFAPICVFLISMTQKRRKDRYNCHCEQDKPERSTFTHQTQHLFFFPPFPLALNIPFSHYETIFPSVLPRFIFFFICTLVPLLYCPPEFPRPVWVSLTKKIGSDNEKKAFFTHSQNKTKNTLNEIKEGRGAGGNK